MTGSLTVLLAAAAGFALGCKNTNQGSSAASSSTASDTAPVPSAQPDGVDLTETAQDVPILGARGLYVMVRDRPDMKTSNKLGFIRLGGIVERSSNPVAGTGCKGG